MQTPLTVKLTEKKLLVEIANETNADWQSLRWFAVGNPPRSIVVVKRGKRPETVCTISKTNNPSAWRSWEPVLAEWLALRETSKRVSHDKLTTGAIK